MKIYGLKHLALATESFPAVICSNNYPTHQYQHTAMNLYSIIDCSERATVKPAYWLKHAQESLARNGNQLTFLVQCKETTTNGLHVCLPLLSPGTQRITKRAEAVLLCLLIRVVRFKKAKLAKEANTYREMIRDVADDAQWEQLESWWTSAAEKSHNETKDRQFQKFTHLLIQHKPAKLPMDRVVYTTLAASH